MSAGSAALLARQLKSMQNDKTLNISAGLVDNNIYEWEVMLMIADDSCKLYGGGFFKARLSFPTDYPLSPPKMKFVTPIWHPNSEFDPERISPEMDATGRDERGDTRS